MLALPSRRERRERTDEELREANADKQRRWRQRQQAEKLAAGDQVGSRPRRPFLASLPSLPFIGGRDDQEKEKPPARNKPFSDREVDDVRDRLVGALVDYFSYGDELLYATNKKHARPTIWALDDEEAGVLADAWLARAKRSAATAARIVAILDAHHNLRVGLILAPRFYATFRFYAENGIGL